MCPAVEMSGSLVDHSVEQWSPSSPSCTPPWSRQFWLSSCGRPLDRPPQYAYHSLHTSYTALQYAAKRITLPRFSSQQWRVM